jgi:hypothetical protein
VKQKMFDGFSRRLATAGFRIRYGNAMKKTGKPVMACLNLRQFTGQISILEYWVIFLFLEEGSCLLSFSG